MSGELLDPVTYERWGLLRPSTEVYQFIKSSSAVSNHPFKVSNSIIEFGGDVGPRVPGTNERHDRGALKKFHTILRYQFGERAGYQCIVQPIVDQVWDG
jgi:hypothetical protein